MPRILRRLTVGLACAALIAAATTLPLAVGESEPTATNAAETQYGEADGCTPGFWKNHTELWEGYSTGDSFNEVFGGEYFDPDITLGEAAALEGGGFKALARHAVAALLNSSHEYVSYGLTDEEIIALTQEALETGEPESIKDEFDALNNSNCSVDANGNQIE